MPSGGIPLDEAELLSVVLEALLYGFSLLMFGATIWTLVVRRSANQVNRSMLAVACSLLLGSTIHLVIDIIRIMQGLILYRQSTPGGTLVYFARISKWTSVTKSYVITAQTLIGDGVVLYRCYKVWQSKLVMIFPALLWCFTAVSGIGSPYVASRVTQEGVVCGTLTKWTASFWGGALTTNLLTTLLLVGRIWHVDHKATRHRFQQSELRPILRTIIDAGVIYSFTLITLLVCFLSRSNGQYVVVDMVTPIISITFYMVIIRVRLAVRPAPILLMSGLAVGNVTVNHSVETPRMEVHITKVTETQVHDVDSIDVEHSDGHTPFDSVVEDVAV